jgi:hypothetical protein
MRRRTEEATVAWRRESSRHAHGGNIGFRDRRPAAVTWITSAQTPPRTTAPTQPKVATVATKAANRALQQYLNFNDRENFDNATCDLRPDRQARHADHSQAQGQVVWDLEAYKRLSALTNPHPTRSIRVCGATPNSTCSTIVPGAPTAFPAKHGKGCEACVHPASRPSWSRREELRGL